MSYRPDNMTNLKQNTSSNLILMSKKAQILQNLSKMTKNRCPNPKNPKKKFEKKFSASKNRKLQIVRNAFSRSFAAIRAKFEGRTDVRSSTRESEVKFRGGLYFDLPLSENGMEAESLGKFYEDIEASHSFGLLRVLT